MEQYEQRGGWWYWRQTLGAVRAHAVGHLVTAAETHAPAAQCAAYICDVVLWIVLGACGFIQLAICTALLVGRTPLTKSEASLIIAISVSIGAALIAAAVAVREIRIRMALRERMSPYSTSEL